MVQYIYMDPNNKEEDIRKQCNDHMYGCFHNCDSFFEGIDDSKIVYSYNDKMNDYHFAPQGDSKKTNDLAKGFFKGIEKNLNKKYNADFGNKKIFHGLCAGKGCAYWHVFNYCRPLSDPKFEYLICHSRLWVDQKNKICNDFGRIQFMRYPWVDSNGDEIKEPSINKGTHIMYPHSDEDGVFIYNQESGHSIYNPSLQFEETDNDEDRYQKIAKAFESFIDLFDNNGRIEGKMEHYNIINTKG